MNKNRFHTKKTTHFTIMETDLTLIEADFTVIKRISFHQKTDFNPIKTFNAIKPDFTL